LDLGRFGKPERPFSLELPLVKRVAVNGNDRHPETGAEYLIDGPLAAQGGVDVGEAIVVFLEDEPNIEADAIVEFWSGWGSGWFGRRTGEWRNTDK